MIRRDAFEAPRARGNEIAPPRGARAGRPLLAAALATVVALAALVTAAPPARADGDPASDYLLVQNVFLPYQAPSAGASAALEQATAAVYQHGSRIKVALIFDVSDLGAIPSLFGDPADYAHFLGLELALWYVGPLLVVMPSGFGIYDGGRSTAAEEHVLQSISVSGGTPDDLTQSATTAVNALEAAGALDSPDITPPLVTAHPADAKLGKPAALNFDVFDDSGNSKATVRIYEGNALLATLTSPSAFQIGTRHVKVRWLVPAKLRSRNLHFCVVATDPAGNQSRPACAAFLRVSA